jgi:predicted MPP superfamily phosphohydrolase
VSVLRLCLFLGIVAALAPDVVAITGDLVDGSVAELAPMVEPLRALRARHGVYFVTGNHEYYSGAREWVYVSRGTGYWGPPMRVGIPAEITALELFPSTMSA